MLNRNLKKAGGVLSLLLAFGFSACGEAEVEESLLAYADDDLRFLVTELQVGAGPEALAEKPSFVVTAFREVPLDSSMELSHFATVEFNYQRSGSTCQVREYRKWRGGSWDRYGKKLASCSSIGFRDKN